MNLSDAKRVDLLNDFPKKNPGNNVAIVVSDAYPRPFPGSFSFRYLTNDWFFLNLPTP
ncbi:hypothetical protein D3C76_861090 [compost metagenome]|jgi:hypothetical protein|uniref:hypothetical protein n=1 Tax=Pseudomonas TaxID=286 RepID=UPI000F93EAC4|nr:MULTISPECIES: hypothetical protein [Pseudomonas]